MSDFSEGRDSAYVFARPSYTDEQIRQYREHQARQRRMGIAPKPKPFPELQRKDPPRQIAPVIVKPIEPPRAEPDPAGIDIATQARRQYLIDAKLVGIRAIVTAVAEHYDITALDILGRTHAKDYARARHVAMYFARQLTRHSLPALAQKFRRADHTTVIYGIAKITGFRAQDPLFSQELDRILEKIRRRL